MESITSSEAMRSFANSAGVFTVRRRSSTNSASLISLFGKASCSARPASMGRKGSSTPMRFAVTPLGLQPMADIAGLVGGALGVDHDRQIAADAERIHVIEEDRPLRIEHVLHIVLGGGQQHVEAGFLHQPIKLGGIEGDGAGSRFGLDAILHVAFPCLL